MLIFCLIVLLVLLLCFLALMPGLGRRKEVRILGGLYAHRGLHDNSKPENSLSAFRAAVTAGYGIELDVRLSADGIPVVMHDSALSRICRCSGTVSGQTLAELRTHRLADSEENIPTLSEVLTLVSGSVPLLIEIKGEDGNTAVCAETAELLDNYDGAFLLQSFNPLYLGWFRRNRPAYLRGLLYTNLFRDKVKLSFIHKLLLTGMLLNFIAQPDFISYHAGHPHEFPLLLCRSLFCTPAFVWTIRDEASRRRCPADTAVIFENFIPD